MVPSIVAGKAYDRVLAELDQDGFAFAIDPLDAEFFRGRVKKLPRARHRLEIVLHRGTVCLRKEFLAQPLRLGLKQWLWNALGLPFYNEAAALLRLRDDSCTPPIVDLDPASRSIYMSYIKGNTLRHLISRNGVAVHDLDLSAEPELQALSSEEGQKRETRLLFDFFGNKFTAQIKDVISRLNANGVAPLDIKLGNVIIGEKTQSLYWVDFERAHLKSYPQWEQSLHEQFLLLNRQFGLGLVTRQDILEFSKCHETYSPVDFGPFGYLGDVSNVASGEGRWRWLLMNQTCWKGKRILDLGANNCLYTLRALQAGAAEAHCVEKDPVAIRQALFIKDIFEQLQGRKLNIHFHETDIKSFLTTTQVAHEYFDLTMALCSIYYLPRDDMEESMEIIGRISKECWLQGNIWTKRESTDLQNMSTTEFLKEQLAKGGFQDVRVIAPRGYSRPLLKGRKDPAMTRVRCSTGDD
jgi:serine/threonine protein kinase